MNTKDSKYKRCSHCSSEIRSSAGVCPYCHESQGGSYIKWIITVTIISLAIVVGYVFLRFNP
ncbi:MAG: hypothetical protein KJS45_08090 [Bacteroidetes bacterium]|nr:hypothetical protein [Bacteroidota bacterium]